MKKNNIKSVLIVVILLISFASYSQIINTIAGNGTASYFGDGGAATAAELNSPGGVVVGDSGNVYISDNGNSRIRKYTAATGIISTIAGNGTMGYGGDGGQATAAELNLPYQVTMDKAGNIYIADDGNNRIRKITKSTGIISTVAGNGSHSFFGDGGQATAAELNYPSGVAIDDSGNIYISDQINCRIRKVTATTGIITTIAGISFSGYSGDGGAATSAELQFPEGITLDSSRNIYLADSWNNRVRKITITTGIISTIAGNGIAGFFGDGGQATAAEIDTVSSVKIDSKGNIYIVDGHNQRIRVIGSSTGIINTIIGNGTGGYNGDGITATSAELYYPFDVALDVSDNIYIGDFSNNRVRKVNSVTGINDISKVSTEVTVYPSPNTGSFILSGITKGQVIELYNYLGQTISSTLANNPTMHFDISNNPNGVYFIRIENKDGTAFATKKIVKM